MIVILVVAGVIVFVTIRLAASLEPRQRIVLVLVVLFAIVAGVMKLVELGMLGRGTS